VFDQNLYAQLNAVDPNAAAQYLVTCTQQAAGLAAPPAVPPVPQANFQQPNLQQGFQQQAAAPQQVAARGTLEDFFNQPSGGGGPSVTSKFFNDRPQGSWLQLTVLADVTNADVQHQKTPQGVLQYFKKNGQDDLTRPKLVLVVKVQVTGSSDGTHATVFPDGTASLWLKKGPVTDDLIRAMTAAGDPSGYPKAGAQMVMQSAGSQPSRTVGFSATKLYGFQYAAPAGGVDPTSQAPVTTAVSTPAPASAVASVPVPAPTPAPAPAASAPVLAPPSTPAPATVPEVPVPNFTPPPPPAPTDPKAAERAELLAKLQGLSS
jgi:hypothetical protein